MNWEQIKVCDDVNVVRQFAKNLAEKIGYTSAMGDKLDKDTDIKWLKFITQRLVDVYNECRHKHYERELVYSQRLINDRKLKLQRHINQLKMIKESCSDAADELRKDNKDNIGIREKDNEQLIEYIFPDEQTKYRALYAAWMDSVLNKTPSYEYFKTFFATLNQNKTLFGDFPHVNLKIYMRSNQTHLVTIKFNNDFVGRINYNSLVKYTNYTYCDISLLQTIPMTKKAWYSFCLLMEIGTTFHLHDNIFQMNIDDELVFWRLFVFFGCDDNSTYIEDDNGMHLNDTNDFRKSVNQYYSQYISEVTPDQLESISNMELGMNELSTLTTSTKTIINESDQQIKQKHESIIKQFDLPLPNISNLNDNELACPYKIVKTKLSNLTKKLAQYVGSDFSDPYNMAFIKFYKLTTTITKPVIFYLDNFTDQEVAKQNTILISIFSDITKLLSIMIKSSQVDQDIRDLIVTCVTDLVAAMTQILDQSANELSTLIDKTQTETSDVPFIAV